MAKEQKCNECRWKLKGDCPLTHLIEEMIHDVESVPNSCEMYTPTLEVIERRKNGKE